MKAVIMAGGKGGRLGADIEKPLIKIEGRTILERTVDVLKDSGIDEIFIAVTNATPRTRYKAIELKVKIVQTLGEGYVEDIQYLMEHFKEFLVVSADLPFLRSQLIKDVLSKYKEIKQPVSVVVPVKDYENMGFFPSTIMNGFVPVGVNIVSKGEDYLFVIKDEQTININTKKELEMILNERATEAI